MVTKPGAIRGTGLVFPRDHDEAIVGAEFEQVQVQGLVEGLGRIGGPMDRVVDRVVARREIPGAIRASMVQDYYNRVYVLPKVLDFGSLASTTRRAFYIWNAWLKPVVMTDFLEETPAGTEVSGVDLPQTFRALAIIDFQGVAFEDGPAEFQAKYTFLFDTGEAPTLILLGERARLLPFGVNWREGYEITKDYKTEVLVSRSGREQRRSIRQTARKAISFSAMARGNQLRLFNRHMATWQNKTIIVGEETKFALVTEYVPPGNTVFTLEEIPGWLQVGQTIFLRTKDESASTITDVQMIVGNTIVTEGVVAHEMPAGSIVLQAQYGRLSDRLSSTRHTASVAETSLDIDINPGSEKRPKPTPLPLALDGRPVFRVKPNWKNTPDLTYVQPTERVDYDTGRIAVVTPIEFTTRELSYLFSGRAKEDVAAIENLFDLMRGRAGEFYYGSQEHDLPFTSDLIAGTRSMEFIGSEFYDTYFGDSVHRAVMIEMNDGTVYVNSFAEEPKLSDGKTIFTFKHNWPDFVRQGSPAMVSWLYAMRFATDKMTTQWLTRTVATIQTSFTTLEDLPYEL